MKQIPQVLILLGFSFCLLIQAREVPSAVFYVKANATGANNGTSWASAYTDLQSALTPTVTKPGDQIWVAAGTYKPTTGTDTTKSFVIPFGVAIYGGFVGDETTNTQRYWAAHQTILSGILLGNIRSNNVVTGGDQTILDGLIISGGGTGMYNQSVSPTIQYCMFTDNTGNIVPPSAIAFGGGMFDQNANGVVTNCTFTGNSASISGGGMFNDDGLPMVINCIFWGDSAPNGPEICDDNDKISTFTHCNIQGSGGSGSRWNSALGHDGKGNMMVDPLFVNPADPAGPDGLWRTSDDGLELQSPSPCIHAGTAIGAPLTDIQGNPRVGAPDIGAYEYHKSAITNRFFYE